MFAFEVHLNVGLVDGEVVPEAVNWMEIRNQGIQQSALATYHLTSRRWDGSQLWMACRNFTTSANLSIDFLCAA